MLVFVFQLKRYRTYAYLLRSRMSQYPELVEPSLAEESCLSIAEEEANGSEVRGVSVVPPPVPDRRSPPNNRYSYRAAIYNSSLAGRANVDSYAAELG